MRTANPALNSNTFENFRLAGLREDVMSIQGTVNKTVWLFLLTLIAASWTWTLYLTAASVDAVMPWVIGGVVGGLIAAIVTVVKKNWAAVTAPIYSILEGLFLGGLSSILEAQFPGIVIQAVGLTFGILFFLLMVYKTGLIKASENFKLGVAAATGGIFLIYLVSIILGFFGGTIPYIHESGLIGIGFSLFVVVIAALNLVLDFDFIESGAASGAPKFMEWYAAFGLMVTLVWLYIEILILLVKLRSRD